MRTFIAIEVSEEIRGGIGRVIAHLKYAGADVKWVRPENIHLTLKFLGEIDEGKVKDVKEALDRIASNIKSFEFKLKDIGAFPKLEYPRVIWIGPEHGAEESISLAGLVDEELSVIGFPKETRPFSPHLTIGRLRSGKNRSKLAEKMILAANSCQFSAVSPHVVSSVALFQSTLTPKGPIYTKLHEARFGQ